MQKKLIALAVAGLVSAPAFAQSNVTIYGVADAGIAVGSHGDNDFRGLLSGVLSGSRIGFRGTEDLGNGLSAVFQLEQGFDIGNGTVSPNVATTNTNNTVGNRNDRDSAFSRQAWVGLKGAFGTVGLGRQYAPGFGQQYDAIASAAISPQSNLSVGAGLTITPNSPARWDNSVTYGNAFGAVKVNAIYSAQASEQATSPDNDNAWGVGAEYAAGGLRVGGVYHFLKDGTNAGDNTREWLLGASYNFGMLTLAGSYQVGSDVGGGGVGGDNDVRLWQVGAIVPVGAAGNVHVAYGRVKIEDDLNTALVPAVEDNEANSWTVAYTHALSKRTTGYVGYNRASNDSNFQTFGVVGAPTPATAANNGEDSSVFALGVRHTF